MLRQHHFSQQQLLAEHVAFAVRRMTVDYLAPARLDDLLVVESEISALRGLPLRLRSALSILKAWFSVGPMC